MASSGNYPTFNPEVNTGQSLTHTSGNLEVASGSFWSSSVWSRMTLAGFGGSTGKYYAEFVNYGSSGGGSTVCGIGNYDSLAINTTKHNDAIIYYYTYILQGNTQVNIGGNYSSAPGISGNEVLRMCWDCSNGKVWLGGSQEFFDVGSGVGDPANGTNPSGTISTYADAPIGVLHNRSTNTGRCIMNFGQNGDFSGTLTAQNNTDENGDGNFYYSVPAGFLALNTKNLIIDSGIDPAQTDDDFPQKQFNAVAYSGTGSTHNIDVGFQPDLVWTKIRVASDSRLVDSSRGSTKYLISNKTDAEATSSAGITGFTSTGYTLSTDQLYNGSAYTYVSWCWRANGGTTSTNSEGDADSTVQANTAAGFSIVQFPNYSGDTKFGHGLTKAPNFIIAKLTASGSNYPTYHDAYSSGKCCFLNLQNAEATSTHFAHSGTGNPVSATTFGLGASFAGSGAGIAYCWHDVEGYSKFGSYEGNDSTDGPFVYTGFRPRLLVIKGVDEAYSWYVFDSARNPFNLVDKHLRWSESDAEATEPTGARRVDFFSTGFKIKASAASLNGSGDTYAYMCWGDVPAKYNNGF